MALFITWYCSSYRQNGPSTASLQQRITSFIGRNPNSYYSTMSRFESIFDGKQKMAQRYVEQFYRSIEINATSNIAPGATSHKQNGPKSHIKHATSIHQPQAEWPKEPREASALLKSIDSGPDHATTPQNIGNRYF